MIQKKKSPLRLLVREVEKAKEQGDHTKLETPRALHFGWRTNSGPPWRRHFVVFSIFGGYNTLFSFRHFPVYLGAGPALMYGDLGKVQGPMTGRGPLLASSSLSWAGKKDLQRSRRPRKAIGEETDAHGSSDRSISSISSALRYSVVCKNERKRTAWSGYA